MNGGRDGQKTKTVHPLGAAGLIFLAVGAVAWAWSGEWRWMVTGAAALVALAVVGAVLDGRKK